MNPYLPIVRRFLEKLRQDNVPIEQAVVYGSRAKGNARADSDIDLCVVSPYFRSRDDAIDYLWGKRGDEEALARLEPIGYPPQDFVDEDPLVWEIKTKGLRII